ncbi:hypothetical protein VB740_15465, partial [Nostoc sp. UHCC 0251]|nr:hypothetical protein [Nostoc sp. UHCC 0251]
MPEYLLLKRVSICKLMLLALMWIQFDENSQNQLTPDYSSSLQVENLTWLGVATCNTNRSNLQSRHLQT